MRTKKGGVADRVGKGYSPNLDLVQREAADPKGEDMAFAGVVVNPSRYRLPGGKECVLILASVSAEPINMVASLLDRAGLGGLLVVETRGEETCLSGPSPKDFALALKNLAVEISLPLLKIEQNKPRSRKGGAHYAAIKRVKGRLKV